jgi:hypothetical protein
MLLDEILAHCAKTSIAADKELVVLLSSSATGVLVLTTGIPSFFCTATEGVRVAAASASPALVQTLFSSNIYQNTTHTFFSDRLLLV